MLTIKSEFEKKKEISFKKNAVMQMSRFDLHPRKFL